jgi:hypothetical protein
MGFQAQRCGLLVSRRIRSTRHLLDFSIVPRNLRFLVCERIVAQFVNGVAVLWPGQRVRSKIRDFRDHKRAALSDDPLRSRIIGTSLLPETPVALAVTLSTTVAVCNVYHPVHVSL